MTGDSSAIAGVGKHHPLLHRPCVISAHEANQAVVAILAASRMGGAHGLALDEERIELRNDEAWFTFVVPKFETEVGRLCEYGTVVVGPLALPHDGFVSALAEARDTAGFTQIVLNDTAEGGGDFVFTGCGELKVLFAEQFKSPEQDTSDQQNHRQPKLRMRQVIPVRWDTEREEAGCPPCAHASRARSNAPRCSRMMCCEHRRARVTVHQRPWLSTPRSRPRL